MWHRRAIRTSGSPALRSFAAAALLALSLLAASSPLSAQTQTRQGVRLEQNFPNPFTPGVSPTIFTYHLDDDGRITLSVYNLIGQEVARLVDRAEERGTHRVAWDGTDANGNHVPAGFYFYKLDAGDGEALGRLRVLSTNQ